MGAARRVSARSCVRHDVADHCRAAGCPLSDSTLTEDGATLKIAAFAERLQTQATQRIDAAHSTPSKSIEEYEGILRRPMEGQASAGPLAAEIRAHCKALSAGERAQFATPSEHLRSARS